MSVNPVDTSAPAAPDDQARRVNEHVLRLPYDCIRSIADGINEVRVWDDPYLGCQHVGKRIDISNIPDDSLPEAATLQAVRHDNIVPILSVARVEDPKWDKASMHVIEIITPFFPRGSVTDALLDAVTFSTTEAIAVIQATLRGLSYLHDVHGICHRDVKSNNILLCDEKVARVADLGVAGLFDEHGVATAVQNPTLYSSPEFAGTKQLTAASDVWGVGLMLRELLGGNFDYASYSTDHVLSRQARRQAIIPASDLVLPIWTPDSLARVYNKATQRDPGKRYQTAREMDEALSRALAVDWVEISADKRWEAPFVHQPGVRVAVTATHMSRAKVIRMKGLVDRGNGWRQAISPEDVTGLRTPQARKFFNQASVIASAR